MQQIQVLLFGTFWSLKTISEYFQSSSWLNPQMWDLQIRELTVSLTKSMVFKVALSITYWLFILGNKISLFFFYHL